MILKATTDRRLPDGVEVAAMLQKYLRRMGLEVARQIKAGARKCPSLRPWRQPIIESVTPYFLTLYSRSAQEGVQRLISRVRTQKASRKPQLEFGAWDVYNPKVGDAVDKLVLNFVQSTLDTSRDETDVALAKLRRQLKRGLKRGEAYDELTQRVQKIFLDPQRASLIARTESSRAIHAADFAVNSESGVVEGKEWLASDDACPICLGFAEQGIIPLDQDFADNGDGPYDKIPYAPGHPGCFCDTLYSVA